MKARGIPLFSHVYMQRDKLCHILLCLPGSGLYAELWAISPTNRLSGDLSQCQENKHDNKPSGCIPQLYYMYHLEDNKRGSMGCSLFDFGLQKLKKKRKTQNKIQTESQRTQNRQKLDDAWFFVSKLTTKLQYRNHTVLPWKLASQTNGIVQKCIMWSKGYWQEWKFSTWKKTVCKKQYPEARDMHETMTWLLT